MSTVININNFIQDKLQELGIEEITAVNMAKLLDEAGILNDSKDRPGLPLRNYLRAGRIEGGFQYPNSRWVIRRMPNREKKLSVKQAAAELEITEQALYKRIERGSIVPERTGEKITIPISEISKDRREDDVAQINMLREIDGIYFEIENLLTRIKRLESQIKNYKQTVEGT